MRQPDVKVLQGARERVARGWCQGSHAQDAEANPVVPHHAGAVCWCLTGALQAALAHPELDDHAIECRELCTTLGILLEETVVEKFLPGAYLVAWNDRFDQTQEEVLALLDETIARLEKEDTP